MFYEADLNEISALRGLRGPNYWGAYTENLGDVGAAVAATHASLNASPKRLRAT